MRSWLMAVAVLFSFVVFPSRGQAGVTLIQVFSDSLIAQVDRLSDFRRTGSKDVSRLDEMRTAVSRTEELIEKSDIAYEAKRELFKSIDYLKREIASDYLDIVKSATSAKTAAAETPKIDWRWTGSTQPAKATSTWGGYRPTYHYRGFFDRTPEEYHLKWTTPGGGTGYYHFTPSNGGWSSNSGYYQPTPRGYSAGWTQKSSTTSP